VTASGGRRLFGQRSPLHEFAGIALAELISGRAR
jgi:hypothetical protein